MYFWNIPKLQKDLVEGSLSQRTVFVYVMLYVLSAEVVIELAAYFPNENTNHYDFLLSILNVTIIGLGSYFVYRYNGGKQGKDFAVRYFSIGFVTAIRLLVYSLPILVLLGISFWDSEGEEVIPTSMIDVVFVAGWSLIYFSLFAKNVEKIAYLSRQSETN